MVQRDPHQLLPKTALIIAIAGAMVSLIFVLLSGQHNKSIILPLLFVAWVLSPFVVLVAANAGKHWTLARVTLYWLTIVLTVVSPVIYSGILSLHDSIM